MPVQDDPTGNSSFLSRLRAEQGHAGLELVHRIDRPASGAVLLARDPGAAAALSRLFRSGDILKTYWAVVAPAPAPEKETAELCDWLTYDKRANKSRIVPRDTPQSREARLRYTVAAGSDRYTLLQIDLLTGRHHQIRAQLASRGWFIKGDVKYGARRGNRDRSIHLLSRRLRFTDPFDNGLVDITAPAPEGDPLWTYFTSTLPSST